MQEPWELHWEDYYYLLGLRSDAEPEAVEGAAKQLLAKYHPDKSGTGSEERFKSINEAREVLTDPVRRWRYDAEYKRQASEQKQPHESPASSEANRPSKKSNAPGFWKGVLIVGGGLSVLVVWWLSGGENSEVSSTLRERPAERVVTDESLPSYSEFVSSNTFRQLPNHDKRTVLEGLFPDRDHRVVLETAPAQPAEPAIEPAPAAAIPQEGQPQLRFTPEQFQYYLRALDPPGTNYELEYGPGLGGMAARTAGNLASGFATLFAGLADIVPYVADTLTSDPGQYGTTVQGFNDLADFMREKAERLSPADSQFVDKAIAGLSTLIGFLVPVVVVARRTYAVARRWLL